MAYISRDPFARTELHRQSVEVSGGCDWCGQQHKSGKLFQYRTESDGGRENRHTGLFCSKSCHDAYHGH
jgi:hypothetical protein